MFRTLLLTGWIVGFFVLSASAEVSFLAHYDTSTNADVAAGNAADLGDSKGTIVTGGKFGSGAHFRTSNQASVYATAGNIQADSGTLMFWYKADTDNLDWPCLFSIGTTNFWSNPPTTNLMIRSLPGYNSTYVYMTDTSGHSYRMNPTGVGGTSWAHVAVTWSASGGTCDFKAYSNGSLTASQTGVTWSGFNFDSTMFVGCFGEWTGPGANGTFDELVIFDTALSDAEIAAIVSSGKPIRLPTSVTGTVVLDGYRGDNAGIGVKVVFQPTAGGDNVTRYALLDSNGVFRVDNVTEDDYNVTVQVGAWLRASLGTKAVYGDLYDLGSVTLEGGDSNGDNVVSFEDFSILQNAYGRTGAGAANPASVAAATGGCGALGILLMSILGLACLALRLE